MSITSITEIVPEPRPEALRKVETALASSSSPSSPSKTETGNDGSNSKGTINTINSQAISFGPLAPGETSETKIIFLRVPYAKTIDNIKIALIDTEGITFANTIFGIEIRNYLDYNLIPSSYFQGVNSDNLSSNAFNVAVDNNSPTTSQYVYLNVVVPESQTLTSGTIRYRWYFDYV